MQTTTKNNHKGHPLYGLVDPAADLGIAILIAETDDGQYEPCGPVATLSEAFEIAAHDLRMRRRDLELGGEPMCPALYKVWSHDFEGEYTVILEIDAVTMKPMNPTTAS